MGIFFVVCSPTKNKRTGLPPPRSHPTGPLHRRVLVNGLFEGPSFWATKRNEWAALEESDVLGGEKVCDHHCHEQQ